MNEHPIIFNGEMVRAILDGRKTQTRRVIKPQPVWEEEQPNSLQAAGWKWKIKKVGLSAWPDIDDFLRELVQYCPYGRVGDRLWVRETWAVGTCADRLKPCELDLPTWLKDNGGLWYKVGLAEPKTPISTRGRWRSGRFMMKGATRIWLEITRIRVERLQKSLGDEYSWDVFREGICQICEHKGVEYDSDPEGGPPEYCGGHNGVGCFENPVELFSSLWDSLNAKRGYSWETNPYVWVIEFKQEMPDGK